MCSSLQGKITKQIRIIIIPAAKIRDYQKEEKNL